MNSYGMQMRMPIIFFFSNGVSNEDNEIFTFSKAKFSTAMNKKHEGSSQHNISGSTVMNCQMRLAEIKIPLPDNPDLFALLLLTVPSS